MVLIDASMFFPPGDIDMPPVPSTPSGKRQPRPRKSFGVLVDATVYPPIMTVGKPTVITPPWAVVSPIRAAGIFPINTVNEPLTIASGGPVQVAELPTTAAGIFPINTVSIPGGMLGPPTWGIGDGKAGVCMGQVCMSPTRAAGGIIIPPLLIN